MAKALRIPGIERGCHELRVGDERHDWRIVYSVEPDAIVILEIFEKGSRKTPKGVLYVCRKRIRAYRRVAREET